MCGGWHGSLRGTEMARAGAPLYPAAQRTSTTSPAVPVMEPGTAISEFDTELRRQSSVQPGLEVRKERQCLSHEAVGTQGKGRVLVTKQ